MRRPDGGWVPAGLPRRPERKEEEDENPEGRGALDGGAPCRRRRRWPAARARLVARCGLRAVSPLGALDFRRLELFRRRLDLVALLVDVDDLVVVALRLRLAAPLFPGRHALPA